MKKIILFFIALILIMGTIGAYPLTIIGWLIAGFGYYQRVQQDKGKVTFKHPKQIFWAGIIVVLLIGIVSPI